MQVTRLIKMIHNNLYAIVAEYRMDRVTQKEMEVRRYIVETKGLRFEDEEPDQS